MDKYYICKKCKYQFISKTLPEQCPDCGKNTIRESTDKEIAEYKKNHSDKTLWD